MHACFSMPCSPGCAIRGPPALRPGLRFGGPAAERAPRFLVCRLCRLATLVRLCRVEAWPWEEAGLADPQHHSGSARSRSRSSSRSHSSERSRDGAASRKPPAGRGRSDAASRGTSAARGRGRIPRGAAAVAAGRPRAARKRAAGETHFLFCSGPRSCNAAWGPQLNFKHWIAPTCAATAGGDEAVASEGPEALAASPRVRRPAPTPLFDADEEFVGDFGPAKWEPAAHPAPLVKPDPSPVPSPAAPRAAARRARARRGASQPLFLPEEEFLGEWEPSAAQPSVEPASAAGTPGPAQACEQGPGQGPGSLAAAEAGRSQLWGSQPSAQPTAHADTPRLGPSLLELALASEPMARDSHARPTRAPWDPPATAPAANDAAAPASSAGAAAGSGVVPTVTGLESAGVAAAPAADGVALGKAKLQAALAARFPLTFMKLRQT